MKTWACFMNCNGTDECKAYGHVEAETAEEAAYDFETIIPQESEPGYYVEGGDESDELYIYYGDEYQCRVYVMEVCDD